MGSMHYKCRVWLKLSMPNVELTRSVNGSRMLFRNLFGNRKATIAIV